MKIERKERKKQMRKQVSNRQAYKYLEDTSSSEESEKGKKDEEENGKEQDFE